MFTLVYAFFYMLSLLPMWVLYRLADVGYLLIYYVLKYRRGIVRQNLVSSFPEKTNSEIVNIEKQFYRWFADYFLESIKLLSISRKQLAKRLTIINADLIENDFKEGTHVAAILGHYCNWEWLSAVTIGLPQNRVVALVYKPIKNKIINHLFYCLRSSQGGVPVAKNDILRALVKYKKQQTMTLFGYIADQSPRWQNIHLWLPFLHHQTPVFTGSERIMRKMNNAVYYAEMSRPKRGYYTCTFRLIAKEPNSLPEHDITRRFFEMLEVSIKAQPHLYLWTHNRWKRTKEEFDARFKVENGKVVERRQGIY